MRSFCGVIKRCAVAGNIQRKRHTAIGISSYAAIPVITANSRLKILRKLALFIIKYSPFISGPRQRHRPLVTVTPPLPFW